MVLFYKYHIDGFLWTNFSLKDTASRLTHSLVANLIFPHPQSLFVSLLFFFTLFLLSLIHEEQDAVAGGVCLRLVGKTELCMDKFSMKVMIPRE